MTESPSTATGAVFSTAALADRLSGDLVGRPDIEICGVNGVDEARPGEITFLADEAHARRWGESSAAAAVITRSIDADVNQPSTRALIAVDDAELALITLLELFEPAPSLPRVGIDGSATIHDTAHLGAEVRIGPHVTIGAGARVEDRVVLHSGVCVYPNVEIGADSMLHANVVLRERTRLGRGVILHQGVSIGADGFGYRPAADGAGLVKMPHIGGVIIEDAVEIGANSCVDRGKFGDTMIGAGTKIDNLVQIGHNCRIGRFCVIVAMTGLSGSVTVGDGVQMGGRVSVTDHVHIGNGVRVGAGAGVIRDIPDGKTVLGIPAVDATETLRQWAAVRKLPDWMKQISRLTRSGNL